MPVSKAAGMKYAPSAKLRGCHAGLSVWLVALGIKTAIIFRCDHIFRAFRSKICYYPI